MIVPFDALGPRIANTMKERGLETVVTATTATLESAIEKARSLTPPGGVVLLSPGAPSFDAFKDYRQRGDTFARLSGFEANAVS